MLLKSIYSQLFTDFPDTGAVAYIGENTHRFTKDYFFDGEQINGKEKKKNCEEEKVDLERRADNKERAGIKVCDANETSEIREHANISDIKEISNMAFFNELTDRLTKICADNKCSNLCYMRAELQMYDSYKEGEDIFVKMSGNCIWLKKKNIETDIRAVCNMLGKVNMIGCVVNEECNARPRVIKVIAIYL